MIKQGPTEPQQPQKKNVSVGGVAILGFPISATVVQPGTYHGHLGCAVALEERPGLLESWSQKGKLSETGTSWLH